MALFGLVLDEFDVPHDNLQTLSLLGAGALAGLVASAVVARYANETKGGEVATRWAWDTVRLILGFEMVRYGMAKVVGMQFYPQYWRLDQRTLDMQPMALAWAFFGRTYGYQAIGGIVKVVSGVLVCFRRTTLLGACLMATALINVVLVNFFYDVPVKLFASLYLTMDLALIARDGPRLWAVFLRRSDDGPGARWKRSVGGVIVALAITLPAAEILHEAAIHRMFHTELLEGVWDVGQHEGLDGLLPEAPGAWDRVYFEKDEVGFIRVGEKRILFHVDLNEAQRRLALTFGDRTSALEGTFAFREADRLRFEGSRDGKPFSIDLKRLFPR